MEFLELLRLRSGTLAPRASRAAVDLVEVEG
jgi:hypothetical protein